tara:strand:- start:88 stop:294 length:207 start_codon:yes stop_codon:yes gene_type:complete
MRRFIERAVCIDCNLFGSGVFLGELKQCRKIIDMAVDGVLVELKSRIKKTAFKGFFVVYRFNELLSAV